MKILKGTVVSRVDYGGNPVLKVIPDKGGRSFPKDSADMSDVVNVIYVSPYAGGPTAGQVMIPEENSQIIYCLAENDADNNYYYLGSIVAPNFEVVQESASHNPLINPDPESSTTKRPNFMPHDEIDWAYNNQSSSYGIKTPRGNQFVIREQLDSTGTKRGVYLKTAKGHSLSLTDGPTSQAKLAGSGDRAMLEITGEDSKVSSGKAKHSAYLHASNNIALTSMEGGMSFSVVDGNNIDITNTSTEGKQSSLPIELSGKESGNINLTTAAGDILIRSSGNGVFIDCLDNNDTTTTPASFQVRSQNKIHMYSANGIDLKSAGDVNIVGRNVNIESDPTQAGIVNINPIPTGAVNTKMGIRKTNEEIAAEAVAPTGQVPFFVTSPGAASFAFNYSYGRNIDVRLMQ